ncbi:MAG: hypothetical protein ACTH5M_09840 [Psychrobacter sp.]|uniref:hypothetical protein n=1 Tax=Psychrobacter sp. AOP7-B1-24 TaxID=3457645 RepID=UPI003FB8EB0C
MSIIDQLEKTVTPAVLGECDSKDSVAYVSLLEQFYAILAARLALPEIYSQLLRTEEVTDQSLFKQLWSENDMQQVVIQELAATHHIDDLITEQLLINSAPLVYSELKILANGQFLPAFLQGEQSALRNYLPVWAAEVINAYQDSDKQSTSSSIADTITVPVTDNSSIASLDKPDEFSAETSSIITSTSPDIENITAEDNEIPASDDDFAMNTDAIHANPSDHHLAESGRNSRGKVRTRSQRNDLLVKIILLIIAIMALALAAWAILIRPNNVPPVEPVVPEPVVAAPMPPVEVLTPVELNVGMDNSGGLSSCSAVVGDEALQNALQQALNTSLGQQASNCELTVQEGVATSMVNLPTEVLPNIFNLLRAVPFARLELQNDRLTLAAPDSMLLQRLVTDIRTLVPAMNIESTAPLPLPENVNNNETAGMDDQFGNEGTAPNDQYVEGYNDSESRDFQTADDDTDDRMLPVPNPNSFDNNTRSESTNNTPSNVPTSSPPPGPFSESEVDEMANTVIIAEPAQVRQ